ncbi:MAG: S41 family peptidase [Anaerolineales bacterium]
MNKTIKAILVTAVSLILLAGTFSAGFLAGHLLPFGGQLPSLNDFVPFAPPTVSPEQQSATPANEQELFKPFWETWNLIHQQYVSQPVDDVKLMEGAIHGMLQTLDVGLNYYENAEAYDQANSYLNGKDYEGIGAYVDISGDYMTIISPIKGSPAEAAGLRAGDKIIALDGKDMTGISPEQVRQQVLGPEGTTVTLTILRKDVDPFDVKITRAKITTPLVESKMRDDGIAYVRLNTFGDTADDELRAAIKELLAQNPKGLILDLRYNGGGYLDQGIAVASEFLPGNEVVVYQKYGNGKLEEHNSTGNGVATDIPMVVLVNEGSASASEIVAGALQDYGRAKLVGVTSYGKGSVQSVNMLSDNKGAVAITSAQWLTPKQRLIQSVGLTPDVYVEITQADVDADRDPQLDAAAETLLAIINGTPLPTSMPMPTPTATPIPVP